MQGYRVIPSINLITIFLVSGIILKTKDVVSALKAPTGFILGMLSILAITPMLGLAVREIPFSIKEFSTGLAIFCAVPTTLSAGVALVQVVCFMLMHGTPNAKQHMLACTIVDCHLSIRCECTTLVAMYCIPQ